MNTVTVEATDVNSNTTTQNYDVDVTAGASRTVNYNANGNMSNNGDGQTYTWDAENRLIQITRGTETTEFTYDGLGRRVRIIEKDNGTETANNWYVWDGTQIVEKRNDTGGSWRQRYYSEGFVDSATGDFFYTRDHLGSIREVVEDDGSTVAARYDYAPYGRTETIGTATQDAAFRFTGHFYHAESELHLAMYRAYDAELGRWISRDPLENAELLPEGPGVYGYAAGSPVVYVDKDGRFVWGAIVGALTEAALQYMEHGTNFECWSGKDLVISASQGALGLGALKNAKKAYRSYKKYKRIRKQFPKKHFPESPAHEVPGEVAGAVGKGAAGAIANEFKDKKQNKEKESSPPKDYNEHHLSYP